MRTRSRIFSARARSTPLTDRAQQCLRLLAEERKQQKLLLARREPRRSLAKLVELERLDFGERALLGAQLDGTPQAGRDRARRAAEPSLDELAQLIHHRRVPVGGQDVDQRLRRDDLPDRRRERRRPDLVAHPDHLVEDLVEPVAGSLRPKLLIERRDEADRKLLLGRTHRDPRRERRDGLVADVLVHEVGGGPELVHVDARREPEPGQRLCCGLRRHAVHRQGDGVDRRREHVGAGARRLDRRSERVPACTLGVETDREAGDLAQL
jgi:hypothetical protein